MIPGKGIDPPRLGLTILSPLFGKVDPGIKGVCESATLSPTTIRFRNIPHLHFNFIPVVEDKNPRHVQTEKICANDRLNKRELQRFHTDLQKYLEVDGIKAKVLTGKTKAQGRNYTVEELKEKYETQKELERLREIERKYNQEHEKNYTKERW